MAGIGPFGSLAASQGLEQRLVLLRMQGGKFEGLGPGPGLGWLGPGLSHGAHGEHDPALKKQDPVLKSMNTRKNTIPDH